MQTGKTKQATRSKFAMLHIKRRRGAASSKLAPVGQGPSGPGLLAIAFGFWSGHTPARGRAKLSVRQIGTKHPGI